MEFTGKYNSHNRQRPHSSYGNDIRTANIIAKSFLVRDDYKQKMLNERQIDLAMMRKHRQSLEKRSAKRFWNSPFAVNILADNEIQENERKMMARTKKTRSLSRQGKATNETQQYLTKLRGEIKKIENGIGYIEEKNISSKILAHKSADKLKRAKQNREMNKKEILSVSNFSYKNNNFRQTEFANYDKLEDLLAEIESSNYPNL